MIKNIKSDFARAFTSPGFWIGIPGVLAVLLSGAFDSGFGRNTVIHVLWYSTDIVQFLLVMVFGAMPFAGAVCEDLEYGYIHWIVIRSSLKDYCISRVITVLASSICAYTAGMMLFTVILKTRCEWFDEQDSVYQSAVNSGSFRTILQGGHFYLYVFLFSLQMGMMIGMLSLISVYISLYITNKLLVLSIPVMAYYFMTHYLTAAFPQNIFFNLDYIFSGKKNVFDNDMMSFAYAVLIMLLFSACLTWLIYLRLRRRFNGGRS
ncbi:MAG: hypothetical protein K2K74_05375 [Lachnospiraceae bacterium]|nr:hypothetical protein [Lachnospiraceae bacterium]